MPNSWREAYSEFTGYVTGNPKIKIGRSVIAIPADVRPEFYQLFDTVRETFLKEGFLTLVNEAEALSKGYKEVRDEVAKLLRLDDISWSASLNWFLQEPTNGLIRVFFNPLFDLLKGKIDAAIFEQVASRSIESSFKGFYRRGMRSGLPSPW